MTAVYRTPEYVAWSNAKQRCTNPKNPNWPNYGGRGIRMCPEWQKSFADFLAHVGQRPSPQHQIDRIDNDGHYEPGNVRWALKAEQSINRRITFAEMGRRGSASRWSAR